jgi:predicted Zn-dependent peptidase
MSKEKKQEKNDCGRNAMPIESITLPNGLRVLLDETPGAASCAVNLCALSGLRYEQPARMGISHMMEHMLFKGTRSRTAREIAEAADDRGANLNAYTCKEYTCFYVRTLPEHLDAMLELLADMLQNSTLSAADLDTEKGVVLEEIAMYEDIPEDLVFDIFYDLVWPDHMLGKNILGTDQSLAAITSEDLRAHLQSCFTPERIVLSVCGAFSAGDVFARVQALFGGMPAGAAPAKAVTPARFCKGLRFMQKEIEQNQIILAFPNCSSQDPKRYHAALLSTILGSSTSSRLFQRLREELGLVYSVDYFNVHHMAEGVSGVSLGLNSNAQCRALEEVLRILRDFPESVTEQELRRAQEQAAAGLVMSLESSAARASRAACNLLMSNREIPMEESIAAYRGVTLEALRDYAYELINPEEYALCVLGECGEKEQKTMRDMIGSE